MNETRIRVYLEREGPQVYPIDLQREHFELYRSLRKAYSAEKAAALAYQGHAASVKDPEQKAAIRQIELDSIQNRKDYAKIFNYKKPTVGSMTSIGSSGAGIDIQELIRLFQFKKRKATEKFQTRLIEQEKEKFVTHRFSKGLVIRLTGLQGAQLEDFMEKYRPSYEFTVTSSEYDFQMYIKKAYEEYGKAI